MCTSAATNTTGHPLRQIIKIPWQWASCAEQRWWTFIYMFGLGLAVSVPDNETVKNSGLARLGSDRVGLATERVGNSGDSAGGLGDKQGGL